MLNYLMLGVLLLIVQPTELNVPSQACFNPTTGEGIQHEYPKLWCHLLSDYILTDFSPAPACIFQTCH